MLVSLEIRNFLLIKKLSIDFIKGFNTFTGETGAGKSIIIDALKLVLGGKNNSNQNINENEITTIAAVKKILSNIIEFQENYEQQELYNNKYFLNFIDKTGSIDTKELKQKFKIFKN